MGSNLKGKRTGNTGTTSKRIRGNAGKRNGGKGKPEANPADVVLTPADSKVEIVQNPPDSVPVTPDAIATILQRSGVRWESKKVDADKINPNPRNSRDPDNLQLGPLVDDIVRKGLVIEPLIIDGDTGETLRGTRRISAVKIILADPRYPDSLKANLRQLDCKIVYGLTEDERTELICDQGGQLGLDLVELIKTVWRLQKTFMSDTLYQVGNLTYTQIARHTKAAKKVVEMEAAKDDPVKRRSILETWLRGTLNDHWFKVAKLGERVRRQLLLEKLTERRPLTEAETKEHTFIVNRDATSKLWDARKKDMDAKKWDSMKDTGPAFAECIAKLEEDFKKEVTTTKRPSVNKIKEDMGQFSHPAIKSAFLHCSGEAQADLGRLDDRLMQLEGVLEAILGNLKAATKKDAKVGTIFNAVAFHSKEQVNAAFADWLKS
jgi:hypothetical protein